MGVDSRVDHRTCPLLFKVEGTSCVLPPTFLRVDFFVTHKCTALITYSQFLIICCKQKLQCTRYSLLVATTYLFIRVLDLVYIVALCRKNSLF